MTDSEANPVRFHAYHDSFASITGPKPTSTVLCKSSTGDALYHEACIYHASSNSVLVTSNQLPIGDGPDRQQTSNKKVTLLRIYDNPESQLAVQEEILFPGIEGAMLNGGVNYGRDSILLCAQGSKEAKDTNGIIELQLSSGPPSALRQEPAPKTLIADFYGIPFNSVNDVVVHPADGAIWFTDPCYGYHQGIRTEPLLPNQVYRYDPLNGSTRAVADGFLRPNGICFSPDLRTVYVTDTGYIHGSPEVAHDAARPSHVYAFDLLERNVNNEPGSFLTDRRLFAFAPGRCPDGIKTDMTGNVYSGCLDGIAVWNKRGDPLGVFQVDGGVANFCFGPPGVIYACNESRFIKIFVDQSVHGALLGTHRPPK